MYNLQRNISLLWAAQFISTAGDAVYQIALLWLVLDVTGSSTITGLVAMAAFLPAMLFGLYAGIIADKYNRKRIMIFSNFAQALTVIAIPLMLYFDYKNIFWIGILAFTRASFSTFFPPALNAFIPMIATKDRLVKINSILTTSGQLAFLIGPLCAGIILSIFSIPYLFIIDSISFLIAILILLFVVIPLKQKEAVKPSASFKDLFSGVLYLSKNKPLGLLFLLTTINNFFIMGPAFVGMLILVKDSLGGTASQYALVEAGLALGMLIGSVFVYRIGNRIKIGKLLLIGMILDGITYSLMYFAVSVNYVLIFIVIHAFGIPMITISRTAIIQRHTPNELHGRLFSLVHLAVIGVTALSAALVGIIANYIDIKIIFFFIGIGAALCGVVGFTNQVLRKIG